MAWPDLEPLDHNAIVVVERTVAMQPRAGAPEGEEAHRSAIERVEVMSKWLAGGTPPDDVGVMVLNAVRADRPYVHTDRIMYAAIEARTKALLEAMPD